jgi:DNA-binding MarR family transcriptional regulator
MADNSLAGMVALMHAADAARAHLESKLAAENLSQAKLLALNALHEAGNSLPLSQLAGRLSCVKSNVTQLVDRLEADGLVKRDDDPKDRRSKLAVMTAAGRKAYDRGMRLQTEALGDLFGGLSEAEHRQLKALMAKIEGASA